MEQQMLKPTVAHRLFSWAASETGRNFLALVFVFGLPSFMLSRTFSGDWPVNHDHPIHLYRIWLLRQHLLSHWTPWSWSNAWFTGCPISIVYPVGGDLLVLAVQALSLGLLRLSHAYSLTLWFSYALYGFGAYYFVWRALASRIAAAIAVLFLQTDPGSNDIGGWFWFVDVGVWTSFLGFGPALIGTVALADLLEHARPRTAAAAGICVGLALLCHPLHLVYFAIAVPTLYLARYTCGLTTEWVQNSLWIGAAIVCGALIACFWYVPYLAAGDYLANIGLAGESLSQVGAKLARGQLFSRMPWLMVGFGFVGILLLLFARRPLPLFISMFTFLAIFFSSSSCTNLLGPKFGTWLTSHMIFPRLLMLIKPFWYGAGAFVLTAAIKSVPDMLGWVRRSRTPKSLFQRFALVAFVCVCVVPLLHPAISTFVREEVRRPTEWAYARTDGAARAAFIKWTNTDLRKSAGFFRIAHGFDQDEHRLTDLGIDVPFPLYKIYRTPTGDHFKYTLGSQSNAGFHAANVRYAIAEHPLNRPDFVLDRTFVQKLFVYRVNGWNPQPFEILQGGGDVRLERFEDELISIRAGPGAHGVLRLNVSFFPKWNATRDGTGVPITPAPAPGVENSLFMQVPLQPGEYRFEYRRGFTDYFGSALCLIGIAGCVGLANPHRVAQIWSRASAVISSSRARPS